MDREIHMKKYLLMLLLLTLNTFADSQEDRETMALDASATQWSFQFAYQTMPDYYQDVMSNGQIRPKGMDDYYQLRIMAPVEFEEYTILPRLTFRHYKNPKGETGFGNSEIFALVVPKSWDWGSGRFGIGPLITTPGDKEVARDEWGYGFAAGIVNASGKWFYGLLFTQSWRSVDPNALPIGTSDTNPLGVAPFVAYRISDGWYVQTADIVAQYDWDTEAFYVPIGVRFGKIIVEEDSSWNIYAEYKTSLIYEDWQGAAVKNSFRFNVSYTLPVGL